MQNGQRDKGAGYWDKEHHDDAWVPVTDMFSKLEKRKTEWADEEKQNQLDKRSDEFVDEDEFEAPVVKAGKGLVTFAELVTFCVRQGAGGLRDACANRRGTGWCASAVRGAGIVRGNCRARIVHGKRGLRVNGRSGCNS